jgi:hypothetical protein
MNRRPAGSGTRRSPRLARSCRLRGCPRLPSPPGRHR